MNFNAHSELIGKHALLSPSNYHWLNYDDDKMTDRFYSNQATEIGTRKHAWAAETIALGIRQKKTRQTLNMYVNDAIAYGMTPEQPLYFSRNCFGTADALSFKKNLLRIHDLKTGVTPASLKQLEIYAALFCMEYKQEPGKIDMELRIYQNNEIISEVPNPDDIFHIMDTIVHLDKLLTKLQLEG